jgi:hypothetical protein
LLRTFPTAGFFVYDDEMGGRLVSIPLNREESLLAVYCFAFLSDFGSMAFGVLAMLPSLSEVFSSPQS